MISVLVRKAKGSTQRRDDIVKMEAKIRVMRLKAKESQGLQATTRI